MKTLIIIWIFATIVGTGSLSARKQVDKKDVERVMRKASGTGVTLPQHDGDFTVSLGEKIYYSGVFYSSTGESYKVEYDKKAFNMKVSSQYNNQNEEDIFMPGGGYNVETSVFTPLKRGKFVIKVEVYAQGERSAVLTYRITVK